MSDPHMLAPELSIYTATELRVEWLAWLAELDAAPTATDADYAVDAAAVDLVDAAGLQLLVSLARSLRERRRVLRLVGSGRSLTQAIESLGLAALLTDAMPAGVPA